jgi:hypothetical protein
VNLLLASSQGKNGALFWTGDYRAAKRTLQSHTAGKPCFSGEEIVQILMHLSLTVARNHHKLSCGYASSKEADQDTRIRGMFHGPRGGRVATISSADERQLRRRFQGAGKHTACTM